MSDAQPPAKGAHPGPAGVELVLSRDGAELRRLRPESAELLIGRQAGCALRLEHAAVSRWHARLRLGAEVVLEDQHSRNGTRVNGTRVTRCTLVDGDEIAIGPFRIRFLRPAGEPAAAQQDAPGTPAPSAVPAGSEPGAPAPAATTPGPGAALPGGEQPAGEAAA
ncbi:MAG TPA: FHA domain-containing protein, partial [Gammaproteobacteria bacterium]